jgi:hypothetical protein
MAGARIGEAYVDGGFTLSGPGCGPARPRRHQEHGPHESLQSLRYHPTSLAYDMNASFMSLELHDGGIHAV